MCHDIGVNEVTVNTDLLVIYFSYKKEVKLQNQFPNVLAPDNQ